MSSEAGRKEYYCDNKIKEILKSEIKSKKLDINAKTLKIIIEYSKGSLDKAKRILNRLADHYYYQQEDTKWILNEIGIYNLGLNNLDIEYLKNIDIYRGIGLKSLSEILNVDKKTIINKVEPFLLKLGFVRISTKGRCITTFGKGYLNKLDKMNCQL